LKLETAVADVFKPGAARWKNNSYFSCIFSYTPQAGGERDEK
jgi:hypothetical protein